jgi:acid phosphatase type 7
MAKRIKTFHIPRGSALQQLHGGSGAAHLVAPQPLPKPIGAPPFRLDLADVIGKPSAKAIEDSGTLVFHTVGDTGFHHEPQYQLNVAEAMERDFASTSPPAFFYHLGDIVYLFGQRAHYYEQFYEPYIHYPAPILAIPGNHDGAVTPENEAKEPAETTSLEGFLANFCAPPGTHTSEAQEAPRLAMTQPNVYWTLTTPLATIVGLYTNVPEHGVIEPDQAKWVAEEIASAPADRALIVATHHPVYSADDYKGSSPNIGKVLDEAFAKAKRPADLVLNGHVHNYQRFTRQYNGRPLTYIVAGAGGYYKLTTMGEVNGEPPPPEWYDPELGLVLNKYNQQDFGYLTLTVTKTAIQGVYTAVPKQQPAGGPVQTTVSDTFTIVLTGH